MIRFEVTGATPEEFAQNAMKAWGLLAIGLQQALSAQPAIAANSDGLSPPPTSPTSATSSPPPQAQTNGSESSLTASRGDPTDAEVDVVMEMYRRGGLIQEKIDERERKKVHSDKVDDLFASEELGRPVGASAAPSEKPTKTAKNSSKGPKLDDLKTRLSEVIVAATEPWGQKRANAYAWKLIDQFHVKKLSELAPEKYEAFLYASNLYLDLSAPE